MKSYTRLLTESKKQKIVFIFGRMNPPTIGHEKVINSVKAIARRNSADYAIFLSQSHDSTKNPLTPEVKKKYFDKMFKNILVDSIKVSPVKTPLEAAVQLYNKGYKDIIFVGGSDRKSMGDLLKKYNDVDSNHGYYKFNSIEFMSAGDRDPDSDDVSGMSASKVREFVKKGEFNNFKKSVPNLSPNDTKSFFNELRKSMKLDIIRESLTKKVAPILLEDIITPDINRDYLGYYTENFQCFPKIKKLFEEIDSLHMNDKNKFYFKESVITIDNVLSHIKNNTIKEHISPIQEKLSKADNLLFQIEQFYNCERGFLFNRDSLDILTNYIFENTEKNVIVSKEMKTYKSFISKIEEACWPGYKQVGMKKKNKKNVPNCVKEEGVKQDPDIKDKEGTQPAKYFKGLSKSTKEKRDAHFKKGKEKHWDDSSAYKPAPGDDVKTKESKYTKAIKKKYPDLYKEEVLDEGKADSSIAKKAEKSGISAGILRQVYNRGVAAWRTGHRPGTTPEQWGHARVNSFISGGKTRTTADADLWKKHKGNK